MSATATRPVVAGVDASAAAFAAIRWAAREAAYRDTTLRLLHACVFEAAPPRGHDEPDLLLEHVHRALRRGTEIAREAAPGIQVEARIRLGLATDLLPAESAGAGLLVLGSHGLGGLRGALIGSVALRVAAAAACPVVVVRGYSRPGGPVVVGLDATESSEHALQFALDEAAAHRAPVLVVHAYPDGTDATEQRGLAARVATWARKYPALEITARAVRDRVPSRALLQAAADARMVVVGTRGRGPVAGGVLRATGNALLAHAVCPVAVVH
ncbi:universal stress protein [Amycolatopsis kentuckyensis]|uniref:universal stress protein n=1 Tax=Amycolatopsis kentuckyensis TaxID=218823 RepID=UPI000A37513A|nr:universal stress protein [Amycolatopsis kentuckyensis]